MYVEMMIPYRGPLMYMHCIKIVMLDGIAAVFRVSGVGARKLTQKKGPEDGHIFIK